MAELEGKVAIVTGGGAGIGRGIATVMAREGATVICTDIIPGNAEDTAAAIRAAGGRAAALQQDVTNWQSCQEVAAKVIADRGRIDILVTNAGVSKSVPITELDEAEWDRVNNVNIKGVFFSCKSVIPHMIERKYGKIVTISSMVGKEGIPLFAHYCASKFAVIGLTQSLAKELAPHNINVNAVCPGVVRTPLWEPLLKQLSANKRISEDEAWGEFVGGIPFARPQQPEDIGEAVAFLASDRARNITAESANVSGGQFNW
jgi:meso-butanediol dehydrogenase / (S,S)-butanediol dehydrogenase / diacetyl reductase